MLHIIRWKHPTGLAAFMIMCLLIWNHCNHQKQLNNPKETISDFCCNLAKYYSIIKYSFYTLLKLTIQYRFAVWCNRTEPGERMYILSISAVCLMPGPVACCDLTAWRNALKIMCPNAVTQIMVWRSKWCLLSTKLFSGKKIGISLIKRYDRGSFFTS